MKRLMVIAVMAFAVGLVASACHSKNDTKNPATATFDGGPPATAPEHHYPRE